MAFDLYKKHNCEEDILLLNAKTLIPGHEVLEVLARRQLELAENHGIGQHDGGLTFGSLHNLRGSLKEERILT